MPTLAEKIALAVEAAAAIASGLRSPVKHTTHTGNDAFGPTNPVTTDREAIVEDSNELVAAADGRMVVAASKLTFLESLAVKEGDTFSLPPYTREIGWIKVNGVRKPSGTVHYITEVWIGKETQ